MYPVCIVVATLFTVNPGGHGIVNRLSDVLGSNGLFVGSNSYISYSLRSSAICSSLSIIFYKNLFSEWVFISYYAYLRHLLRQSAT